MDIDLFFRFLLTGIGNGAVYALVAMALVLIFRTTGLLNLAQGEMALFSTYLGWKLTVGLGVGLTLPFTRLDFELGPTPVTILARLLVLAGVANVLVTLGRKAVGRSGRPTADPVDIGIIVGAIALTIVCLTPVLEVDVTFFTITAPIGLAILLTVVISMVLGAVIERTLIRPVHGPGKSPLNVLIVMLGLFLALNALAQLLFSDNAEPMPKPWPSKPSPGSPTGSNRFWSVGDVRVQASTVALLLSLIVICFLLYVLFQRTKVGLKLRAVASNPESARLVGINSSRMLMLGWAMAAGLGAFAGVMVAAERGRVDPGLMAVVLVYSSAAAALGGFDSPVGAVVGGMIVAIAESMTTGYVEQLSTIELVVPFGLILLVLLVRPTGLFGKRTVERV
jgi:branched-chain amino acid transport system permease protein